MMTTTVFSQMQKSYAMFDNNCNGQADEDVDTFYADADDDGFEMPISQHLPVKHRPICSAGNRR